jgi:hypothetical protein
MKKFGTILLLAIFCMLGCHESTKAVDFVFSWTAPGDDGSVGTASKYEIKYAIDSVSLINSWATCTSIPASLAKIPKVAGTPESLTVTLTLNSETTYFFGIKAADEVPNWSPVSNIVRRYIPDITPPAMIINFGWK